MFEYEPIAHTIQKHIMAYLMDHETARFRDMRPPKTDTNLYSYHLKLLLKQGFVVKTDDGYRLGMRGAVYVDRVSSATVKLRPQPKIITMLVIQNDEGQVLLFKKKRQPFIGLWTLPYGKVHNGDISVRDAALREIDEKLNGLSVPNLKHIGDSYLHVTYEGSVALSTLVHIFYGTTVDTLRDGTHHWVEPLDIRDAESAPGIVEVVQFALISKTYFFEEVSTEWR
jgi:8-oxo-dGTP pyrophosphatase MutT (NUDIX family)